MSNIRIEDIKPGDEVQVAEGKWVECGTIGDGEFGRIFHTTEYGWLPMEAATDHKPAKPAPPVEWLTQDDYRNWFDSSSGVPIVARFNQVLRERYGPPPVPRVYKVGDVLPSKIMYWDGVDWVGGKSSALYFGDIWLPQPPAPEGVE